MRELTTIPEYSPDLAKATAIAFPISSLDSKLGINRVIAQVLPQQKEQVISKIKEQEHKVVAMIGDGINDAPALARADLGIAIGSGTDIAKETGGIILIKDDLRDIVTTITLSYSLL